MPQDNKAIERKPLSFDGLFCIYKNRSAVFKFLDDLSKAVLIQRVYVELDFSGCSGMSAAAGLLLFAEVTRCQNVSLLEYPYRAVEFIWPDDKDLLRLLKNSGFWKAVQPGGEKKLQGLGMNDDIQFCTGNDPAEDLQAMESLLCGKLGLSRLPQNIGRAINEAFLNIVYHAYVDADLHPFMYRRWWLYCYINYDSIERVSGSVVFLIYDKGVGIPQTVRQYLSKDGSVSDRVASLLFSDSVLVLRAFEEGFSCSGASHRGLGTEDLKMPLINDGDSLLVLSGKGIVEFDRADCSGRPDDQEHSVGGTLLEWELKFNHGK